MNEFVKWLGEQLDEDERAAHAADERCQVDARRRAVEVRRQPAR
jgi:hypothetical protein